MEQDSERVLERINQVSVRLAEIRSKIESLVSEEVRLTLELLKLREEELDGDIDW